MPTEKEKEWQDLHNDGYFGPEPPDPIVECSDCGDEGPASGAYHCENCGDYYCPTCGQDEITEWREMEVCHTCKQILTTDKGLDLADLPEDDWREDR